jgi:outer membrane autotransporter protein
LLAGTALVSTLLFAAITAPSPALAVDCTKPPPPGAIVTNAAEPITCVNTEPRSSATAAIQLLTQTNAGSFIDLYNSGPLTGGTVAGIIAQTLADYSPITIINVGPIDTGNAGIAGQAVGNGSDVAIDNSGDIVVHGGFAIQGLTGGADSSVAIENSGALHVSSPTTAHAIDAATTGDDSPIAIDNSGNIFAYAGTGAAVGIFVRSSGAYSPIAITNAGDIVATSAAADAFGISADTFAANSPIAIDNGGNITATGATTAVGIFARTRQDYSSIAIQNRADVLADGETGANGIEATIDHLHSDIFILNEGEIEASSPSGTVKGISTFAEGRYSYTKITNVGSVRASGAINSYGIWAHSEDVDSDIVIVNAGNMTATGSSSYGVHALANGKESDIVVQNYGRIEAKNTAVFIEANYGDALLQNYGQIKGGSLGVLISGDQQAGIINRGSITADSLYAIKLLHGIYSEDQGSIVNFGSITGFIKAFGLGFYGQFAFINEKGGVFEARLTSTMGGGDFFNEEGAIVHTAADPTVAEATSFTELTSFQNKGLISLQDDAPGDSFTITSAPYSYSPLSFVGSGKSTLAVDAFLGGPGSTSDILIVNGDVSGKTKVQVNDTNPGPGVFNKQGIPVVYVNGATPNGNEFFLPNPIDTGFFDYDLFFRPTGSGVFELKSFLGQGAFVLPQLITAAQDQWHSGSSTWFDRTADLRVLLNGGAAPAETQDEKSVAPQAAGITPAVWARGSGGFLNRDDTEGVTAYGRNYQYNLNRDLQTIDFQSGIDLGKRGLLSDNDILVFGALGGFIHSDLNYDAINREFTFNGGQVGGYATYLRGGLFVDTLVNVHLMDLDTRTLGFPNSLNATTVGVRTDSGYRFGGFRGGAFIEPLATISVDWANIDGFSQGGNKVSFNDDANVQGRLGLRVGTTTQLGYGITAEPFVIGSLWGNLSNDNQATLVSTGTTFILEDHLQDVWGEVSGGVNFFNPTASTSVFAKVDVTFGEDIDGIGGKAGMRVSW